VLGDDDPLDRSSTVARHTGGQWLEPLCWNDVLPGAGVLQSGGGYAGGPSAGNRKGNTDVDANKKRGCPAGASASGIKYSADSQLHIMRGHGIFLFPALDAPHTFFQTSGGWTPRSQYFFQNNPTPAESWSLITQINAATFDQALSSVRFELRGNEWNAVFDATLGPQNNPIPGARPYIGYVYAKQPNTSGPPRMLARSNRNRLVTEADCQTAVTSYVLP
jgi:hypothetical protein